MRNADTDRLMSRMVTMPLPIADGVDTPCITLTVTKARKNPTDYISGVYEGHIGRAHQAAYAYWHMEWSYSEFKALMAEFPNLTVHHLCHRRHCVNPTHLQLTDRRANSRDAAMQAARSKRRKAVAL